MSARWQLADLKQARPRSPAVVIARTGQAGSLTLVEGTGAEAGDGRTLSGVFSVLGVWQQITESGMRFMEYISPTSFDKTIAEPGRSVPLLYGHGRDPAIGSQALGKLTSLSTDGRAGRYEARLFDGVSPLLLSGLRSGSYGSSFRGELLKRDLNPSPRRGPHNPHGLPESVVREVRLMDVGPCSTPAYPATVAAVRSLEERAAASSSPIDSHPAWLLGRDVDDEPWRLCREELRRPIWQLRRPEERRRGTSYVKA